MLHPNVPCHLVRIGVYIPGQWPLIYVFPKDQKPLSEMLPLSKPKDYNDGIGDIARRPSRLVGRQIGGPLPTIAKKMSILGSCLLSN